MRRTAKANGMVMMLAEDMLAFPGAWVVDGGAEVLVGLSVDVPFEVEVEGGTAVVDEGACEVAPVVLGADVVGDEG